VSLVERGLPRALDQAEQRELAAVMAASEIDLRLDLGAGSGEDEIYFSDLGHEYVTINAEYHT
jgi:glutamate N-acetyltransferase/amino-acid N-acetyltransferase